MLPAETLPGYTVDGLTPQAAVRPENRDAISQVMEWAARAGAAVAPWGGGTQRGLGNVPARLDLALDLTRCNRLLDFQPDDLTVTVEAGITLESLQRELAQGGKYLALEGPQPAKATIGGMLATSSTGPRRFAYGPPRDWLIGIGVVAADGTESKAGGRVVKNVTGYDLNKLYTGSLGTLGIIVEASFKLSPAPLYSTALIASFQSGQSPESSSSKAVAAAQTLANQRYSPQGLQVFNRAAALRTTHPQIREVAADSDTGRWVAVAFYEGRDEAIVRRRMSDGANLLGSLGAGEVIHLNQEDSAALLAEATDLGWEPETPPRLAVKLNVPPSTVENIIRRASQPLPLDLSPAIVADPGFGTVKLLWWRGPGQEQPAEGEELDVLTTLETIDQIRAFTHQAGGTAVVEWCPLPVKRRIDVWDGSAHGDREIQIMRQIKEKFDPAGILNPGRFLGGI